MLAWLGAFIVRTFPTSRGGISNVSVTYSVLHALNTSKNVSTQRTKLKKEWVLEAPVNPQDIRRVNRN